MPFYDLSVYGCEVRNACSEKTHWHTIRPYGYSTVNHPGNWHGYVAKCDGDLASVCELVKSLG
jgi:hypothetical protein